MEDQKLSDKRKAPDKNVSSEDLSDGSLAQTPLKRPRMDLNAEEIENDPFAFPEDMIGIPTKVDDVTDEILFKETTESNSNSQPKTPVRIIQYLVCRQEIDDYFCSFFNTARFARRKWNKGRGRRGDVSRGRRKCKWRQRWTFFQRNN